MNQFPLIVGVNDLATLYPKLAREWDYEKNGTLTPNDIQKNSNKKCWWKCEYDHSWQAAVYSRTYGKGCPYCSNRFVLQGFNDFATMHPELLDEWDYEKNHILPSEIIANTNKKVWWIGICGHSWLTSVLHRVNGCGCPYCAGRRVLKGFNDLASQKPELLQEWDYELNDDLVPEEIYFQSHKKVWWRCKKGHSWKIEAYSRIKGSHCPYCTNRKPIIGENDFATMHPELLDEWDYKKNIGISPQELTHQTRKCVWWKCKKGHEWRTEIYHRANGSGCPICGRDNSRKFAKVGLNDVLSCRPEIASEWDYDRNEELRPEEFSLNSQRRVWWKCKNGHHWRCIIQGRIQGRGCPYCSGKRPNSSKIL